MGCRLSLLPTLGTILSKVWKNGLHFFQCSEQRTVKFPTSGKNPPDYSKPRKLDAKFFQPLETRARIVPTLGTRCDSARRNLPTIGMRTAFSSNPRKELFEFFQSPEALFQNVSRFGFPPRPAVRDPPSGRCACAPRPLFFPDITGEIILVPLCFSLIYQWLGTV